MKKFILLTNDVETTSIWNNILSDETGIKVYKEGMPLLLDLYAKYNIKTTFFFCADIVKLCPNIVKMVIPYGHEVGSHGLSHEKKYGFDIMPYNEQKKHLIESKKILEDISGHEVISFRSPALRVNESTARALIDSGYKIDSSIASQRFDFFMSFGSIKKLNWLFAPRLPYYTSYNSIFKKGNSSLLEIPISAFIFPYIGTLMRISPSVAHLLKIFLNLESNINNKPIVFDIHPNECIEEKSDYKKINKRTNNLLNYILKDYLRTKLKRRNLGFSAIKIYESHIKYFHKRNYIFCTLKEYYNYVKDKNV